MSIYFGKNHSFLTKIGKNNSGNVYILVWIKNVVLTKTWTK